MISCTAPRPPGVVDPTGVGRRRLRAIRTVLLASGLALAPLPAFAQDFTVGAGQTVGQQVMTFDGDRGVIEAGGTVSTAGAYGVEMKANDQLLSNNGLISTSGIAAFGINNDIAGNNAAIANFGSIQTEGFSAFGIFSGGTSAEIANSGSIETVGNSADGIRSTGADAEITNSGSIHLAGDDALGILSVGADAEITNSGNIRTEGSDARGIFSGGTSAQITNSGSIETVGDKADGIRSTSNFAEITNSGSIHTEGPDARGIWAEGASATVTNSGTIISEQAAAIQFDQGGATLNLLAGTAIEGAIEFSGAGNRVTFGPGLNAFMTFSGTGIPGVVETSGNPYVVNGNTIAVLDRAGFVLAEDMAFAIAGDVAGAAGSGLGFCLPEDGEGCATRAWLTGFGGFGGDAGDAVLAGFEHVHGGALAGFKFVPGGGIRGGVFVGAAAARGIVGTSQETLLHGAVAGGHAGIERDGYFADFYAALGMLQNESLRTVADNSVTGGLDLASATYAGYFLNPAVTVGADIETAHGTLTPSVRLRYTGLIFDGYAESGTRDGLVVDARAVHEVDLRAQLALALTPAETEQGVISSTLRAGADAVHRQGDTITGEMMGQSIAFASGGDGTRYRGFAALDLAVALTGGAALTGSLEAGADTAGGYSALAQAGISGAF